MNKNKQFKKVNELYNSMCCVLVYNDKELLNNIIDNIKIELEKLKDQEVTKDMTREDLKNYKYTQEWIKDRTEHIEEYKTSITNITSVLSDMPKRKQRNRR